MSAEIKQTLYRNFNVEIDAEDIRELTFSKIAQMCANSESHNDSQEVPTSNKVNGQHVDSCNAMLSEEVIHEVTNDRSHTNKIFFLPPIEGKIDFMLPLAERLKANVYGLQCTKDIDSENLKDYANYFVKVIRNVQSKGPYFLCGYSWGGSASFEIVVQLEKLNEKVQLFLIDGTPSFVNQVLHLKFNKGGKWVTQSRTEAFIHFLQSFGQIDPRVVS